MRTFKRRIQEVGKQPEKPQSARPGFNGAGGCEVIPERSIHSRKAWGSTVRKGVKVHHLILRTDQ